MPTLSRLSAILMAAALAVSLSGIARGQDEPSAPERKRLPRDDDRVKRPPIRLDDGEDRLIPRDRLRPRDERPERSPLPPLGPPGALGRGGPGAFGPGGRGIGDYDRLRREDPEMFKHLEADREYDRQTMELAERYRKATEQERDAIRKELAEVVTKHFEARQQRRELELKRMDEQLARLRDAIKRRQDSRRQIIDRRVSELVGSDSNLDF